LTRGSFVSASICVGDGGFQSDDVCDGGQWATIGVPVGSSTQDAMMVSHLLFADDTLIFCDPIADQIRDLRCLLLCFEAASV
jgi:hypothetical protein